MSAFVQVLQSLVFDGWAELDDGNVADVVVTATDVVISRQLVQADDLSRVVNDRFDLGSAQVVEDSSPVAVDSLTRRTATCPRPYPN